MGTCTGIFETMTSLLWCHLCTEHRPHERIDCCDRCIGRQNNTATRFFLINYTFLTTRMSWNLSPTTGTTSLCVSRCHPGDTLQCVDSPGRHMTNVASLLADHIRRQIHVTIGRPAGLLIGWTVRQNVSGCYREQTYREDVPSWTTWQDSLENRIELDVSTVVRRVNISYILLWIKASCE